MFFLFNNDAIIVNKATLRELVEIAESNPNIGTIGPNICDYFHPEKVWAAGGKIDLVTGAIKNIGEGSSTSLYSGIKQVGYVTGCALLIKREVIEKVGVFDNNYFLVF